MPARPNRNSISVAALRFDGLASQLTAPELSTDLRMAT